MYDTQRVTLSQSRHLIAPSRSVRIVVFNEPQQTNLSAITTNTNIPRSYGFYQFFVRFISFILDRKQWIAFLVWQTGGLSAYDLIPNNMPVIYAKINMTETSLPFFKSFFEPF